MEFYDENNTIQFSALFSTIWDIKCQIHFSGIRSDTINIKSIKTDVNVSETQNPVDFYDHYYSTLGQKYSKFAFNFGACLMTALKNARNIA